MVDDLPSVRHFLRKGSALCSYQDGSNCVPPVEIVPIVFCTFEELQCQSRRCDWFLLSDLYESLNRKVGIR